MVALTASSTRTCLPRTPIFMCWEHHNGCRAFMHWPLFTDKDGPSAAYRGRRNLHQMGTRNTGRGSDRLKGFGKNKLIDNYRNGGHSNGESDVRWTGDRSRRGWFYTGTR